MPALAESNFLQALGWAIINCFWQMALLWVLFKVVLSLNNKIKASAKAAMASFFLFAGFVWFIISFISAADRIPEKSILTDTAGIFLTNSFGENFLVNVLPYASVAYLVLFFIPLRQFIRNYRYVQIIRKNGLSKIDVEWRVFVQKLSARLNIKKQVKVWVSEFVNSPVTIGYLKPVILIPVAAINHLTPRQMEAVLLHELAHIRRYDYLINLLINCIKTVLYFNPFVRLFINTIEEEREACCDDFVVRFQYDVYSYASALLILEKSAAGCCNTENMAMAATGKRNSFLKRIENLLGRNNKPAFSVNKFATPLLGLIFVLAINAFLFVSKENDGGVRSPTLYPAISLFPAFSEGNNLSFHNTANPSSPELAGTGKKDISADNAVLSGEQDEFAVVDIFDAPGYAESPAPPTFFYNVNYAAPVIPDLTKEQEKQLKATLEATKKIYEESQWKEIERSYADAFNSAEKEKIKEAYEIELNEQNWQQVETQLKLAYQQIDWANVNARVNSALAEIKVDSIANVFNITLNTLCELEKDMKKDKITCIPDTDITLKTIADQKQKIKAELNKITAAKAKRIIRL